MINKNENGVTLVALVITIIVLLIIASISITGAITGADTADENKLLTELDTVQHAILQRYTKAQLTGKDLPGDSITTEYILNKVSEIKSLNSSDGYYELTPDLLNDLGITNATDTYIVNYKTGEVINETHPKTKSGKLLYTYAVSSKQE